jgi:tripartite-type tricarboxylate transporter receptor subunit TctC
VKLSRRKLLHLAASATALPALSQIARAQTYPARPVRVLVGYAAGGPADTFARLIGQSLAERFHQPFVVENRPGAGSNIAAEAVARSAADGHTLLLTTAANAINATLYKNLRFDFARDFAPVATLSQEPLVLAMSLSTPVKALPEFVAYAKANPGKITMASAGNGTVSHVSGELFKMLAGINMTHVPYRGAAPALSDLLAAQADIYFSPMSGAIEYVRSGRLRALAVTTNIPSDALPDTPSVSESVPGYMSSQWYGLAAPQKTPTEIVDKLNAAVNATLTDTKFKQRLADLGATTLSQSPTQFAALLVSETEKWGKVVKFSGAEPE